MSGRWLTRKVLIVTTLGACFGILAIISFAIIYVYRLPLWLIPVFMLPGLLAVPVVIIAARIIHMDEPTEQALPMKGRVARKLLNRAFWVTLAFVALTGLAGSPLGIYHSFNAAPLLSEWAWALAVTAAYLISMGGVANGYLTLRKVAEPMMKPERIIATIYATGFSPAISALLVVVLTGTLALAVPLYVLSVLSIIYFRQRLGLLL